MILAPNITRRELLGGLAGTSMLFSSNAVASLGTTDRKRMMVIIMRGAVDGLSVIPTKAGKGLEEYRSGLIEENPLKLNSDFDLHPALSKLQAMFLSKQASFVHAIAGPQRTRSHFAGQDALERGNETKQPIDGWINRVLQSSQRPLNVVSIGKKIPLICQGPKVTQNWSPRAFPTVNKDLQQRALELYEDDPVLKESLVQAYALEDQLQNTMMNSVPGRSTGRFSVVLGSAGRILGSDKGPDIVTVSLGGWDTHSRQKYFLTKKLTEMDDGLALLKTEMGDAWKHTKIVVVTEFGRTIRQNGTFGTDHGTASIAMLLGGGFKGGQVLGDWPGIRTKDMYDGRDLNPTTDYRGLFKAVLQSQFGVDKSKLDHFIFPNSQRIQPLSIG